MTPRDRAIEICNNLSITLGKMVNGDGLQPQNEMFTLPRPKKSVLVKIKKDLITKYNIKKSELWKSQQL